MTPRQLEILQHTLGVDQYGRGPKYRNYFCADGDDETVCRELIALGYMRQHATTETVPYFNCSVTDEGIAAMTKESPAAPKLTKSQERYASWLRVCDCFPDWNFGDWLKHCKQVSK